MTTYTYQIKSQKIVTDEPIGVIRSQADAYNWIHAMDENPGMTKFLGYDIRRSPNGQAINLYFGNTDMHDGKYPSIVEALYHNRKVVNEPIRTHLIQL